MKDVKQEISNEVKTAASQGEEETIPLPVQDHVTSGETTIDLGTVESRNDQRQDVTPLKQFGDYELLDEIARGGMGVVYRAKQKKANRIVALKMILSGNLADEEEITRFYTEAEAAANLDHPYIVPIFDVGEQDGQHFFSMGFVDGPSLKDSTRDGPLPPNDAAEIVAMISEAVAYAHDNGIIHRDLKPANVLLDKDGKPRVTDFGLAKRIESDNELTATGQVMGTPSFMPPEQALGETARLGPAADVYSLGAILYTLLTGRPPFQAANMMETLMQVIENDPVELRVLNPAVDRDLETICLKCLEKDIAKRYSNGQELVDELHRFLRGEPIKARAVGRVERGWRWCRRNRLVTGLVSAIAVTLVVGLGVSIYFAALANRRAERAEEGTRIAATTLETMINTVQQKLSGIPGARRIRREILRDSLANLEKIAGEVNWKSRIDQNSANVLVELARLYEELGDDEGFNATDAARTHFERAVEIFRQLPRPDSPDAQFVADEANALDQLGNFYLNVDETEHAKVPLEKALALRRQVVEMERHVPQRQFHLSITIMNWGDYHAMRRDFKTAIDVFQESIQICERLARSQPDELRYKVQLAQLYEKVGDCWHDLHDNDAALEWFEKSFELCKVCYARAPESPDLQDMMSFAYERLGNHWLQVGDGVQALECYQQMLEMAKQSIASDPENRLLQDGMAVCYDKLANTNQILGNAEAAADARREANEIRRRLSETGS